MKIQTGSEYLNLKNYTISILRDLLYLILIAAVWLPQAKAQTDSSGVKGMAKVDSIPIFIGADTVYIKKYYFLEFPAYRPLMDSLAMPLKSGQDREEERESELEASGSISRGIQVSSNASVSLQSSLYLKIKGSLSENYTVSGVLTEKTSPLQPIGNTRRLNDFDRVLVTVNGPALTASIGDIDIHTRNGKFGFLDRSIEGLDLEARSGLASVRTSLGFSYGQNHLLQIQGKDGKQGPYRLSGKNGERFIIVIAGSEKVKIDDHLLQRGESDDYIIDYNAAEITFTQKRILSSNSRISVDFEYVPDIYLASYSFGKQLVSGGLSLGDKMQSPFYLSANWQEFKDDKSNPLGNVDKDRIEAVFASLSDTVQTTSVSSIRPDSANGDYVLTGEQILVYAGDGLGAYSVDFNFVGLANGKYRKELGSVEDFFVYDTVGGEYLPSDKLIAPQSHSVLSVTGGIHQKAFSLNTDFGVSRKINNLYARQSASMDKKAWNIELKSSGQRFEVLLGDKYFESGFLAHDKIESLEYYRLWKLTPRNSEEEHLSYTQFRLGSSAGTHLNTERSQLERDGRTVGQQLRLNSSLKVAELVQVDMNSLLTDIKGDLSQLHAINSLVTVNKFRTALNFGLEEGFNSGNTIPNDHLTGGIGLFYDFSEQHKAALHFDQRQDYRLDQQVMGSILSGSNYNLWSDKRKEWAAEYSFAEFVNTNGMVLLKYRELLNDSSGTSTYSLGNIKLNAKAWEERIRYAGEYVLDEEHIPKYDFQYVLVDSGYGDYSFDPFIEDYIPISGGRYIRQRVFSDNEEQVRTYENSTQLEYVSHSYGKHDEGGVKARLGSETRSKLQVKSGSRIQDQELLSFDLNLRTDHHTVLSDLNYQGKSTNNHSELYNYGAETSQFNSHELNTIFSWNIRHSSKLGVEYEAREREVEYNILATESWLSYRPYIKHTFIYSAQQKMLLELKYSNVDDLHQDKTYTEAYLTFDHSLSYKRRGRIDQRIMLSKIQSDVSGIPYSIFSGRQPGNNWKYTLNTRYTFSNRFQLAMNYSMEKRGAGRKEQFLRLEGRTHF
ncbi:MAG: hypothetical protein K9N35_01680 [Candidatus Marinimicrobia bacterium]|nr:hypothetical protein [Candidatus Neomarinimicrobiota bacterium]